MKLALKLVMLIAVVVTVAVFCGGWKWAAKPKTTGALAYAIAPADANGPVSSTSTDISFTPDGWTWDTGE